MNQITLIFPHQLFRDNPAIEPNRKIYLVEESLFFKQYRFHKQKIAFHRASMKFYENYLRQKGLEVEYIESIEEISDVRKLITYLGKKGTSLIHFTEVSDNWLNERVRSPSHKNYPV